MNPSEDWDGHTSSLAEQALGYVFQNKSLLKQCFTHKSFADNNQRIAVSERGYRRGQNDGNAQTLRFARGAQ